MKEKCYSCGGKGTYSQIHGVRGAWDFHPSEDFEEKPTPHIYPCSACNGTGYKLVSTPESTWEERFEDLPNTKMTTKDFIRSEIQLAEERGRKERVEEIILAENEEIKIIKEQVRKAERTALREVIKKSRTSEETFGVGIREETARNQILVDIELLQD